MPLFQSNQYYRMDTQTVPFDPIRTPKPTPQPRLNPSTGSPSHPISVEPSSPAGLVNSPLETPPTVLPPSLDLLSQRPAPTTLREPALFSSEPDGVVTPWEHPGQEHASDMPAQPFQEENRESHRNTNQETLSELKQQSANLFSTLGPVIWKEFSPALTNRFVPIIAQRFGPPFIQHVGLPLAQRLGLPLAQRICLPLLKRLGGFLLTRIGL